MSPKEKQPNFERFQIDENAGNQSHPSFIFYSFI